MSVASKTPSTRSERPQSFSRRSGSTPGRWRFSVSAGTRLWGPGSRSRTDSGVRVGSVIRGRVLQTARGRADGSVPEVVEHGIEARLQPRPVASADHPVAVDQLLVPGVDQG